MGIFDFLFGKKKKTTFEPTTTVKKTKKKTKADAEKSPFGEKHDKAWEKLQKSAAKAYETPIKCIKCGSVFHSLMYIVCEDCRDS